MGWHPGKNYGFHLETGREIASQDSDRRLTLLSMLVVLLLEYGLSWLWSAGNLLIVGLAVLGFTTGSILAVHVPSGSRADRWLQEFSRSSTER